MLTRGAHFKLPTTLQEYTGDRTGSPLILPVFSHRVCIFFPMAPMREGTPYFYLVTSLCLADCVSLRWLSVECHTLSASTSLLLRDSILSSENPLHTSRCQQGTAGFQSRLWQSGTWAFCCGLALKTLRSCSGLTFFKKTQTFHRYL